MILIDGADKKETKEVHERRERKKANENERK